MAGPDSNSCAPRGVPRVWRGIGLVNWIRFLALRPAVDWSSLPAIASLTLTSALNSLLNIMEGVVFSRQITHVTLNAWPIFILGHWRSGTTLLHNLLSLDRQFGFLNLYQTLFPGHFLLTERWMTRLMARRLPVARPVDMMPLAWDLPQEDETALLIMTLCSPYLSVAFPDQPARFSRFGNLASGLTERELVKWKRAFVTLLRKAALRNSGRPLILKSPTHTSRIPLLLQLFPQARFIYLVRDPYQVYGSTIRLRRSMCEINAFTRAAPVDLEKQVLDDYMKMYHAYHLHRALIDRAQLVELKYESLVADPASTIGAIYEKLELCGFDEVKPKIELQLAELRQHRTSTPPLTRDEMARVYEHWQPAFRRYGYPSRL
jgi:hypothetical protein